MRSRFLIYQACNWPGRLEKRREGFWHGEGFRRQAEQQQRCSISAQRYGKMGKLFEKEGGITLNRMGVKGKLEQLDSPRSSVLKTGAASSPACASSRDTPECEQTPLPRQCS